MFALMTTTWASAQTERLRVGERSSGIDQLALKKLVDTFSNLADVKDVNSQMDLFTEDAEVHSKAGEHVSVMKGKEQIGNGKRNQSGVRYHDTYVKQDGKWLIKRRESNFLFTTIEDMK